MFNTISVYIPGFLPTSRKIFSRRAWWLRFPPNDLIWAAFLGWIDSTWTWICENFTTLIWLGIDGLGFSDLVPTLLITYKLRIKNQLACYFHSDWHDLLLRMVNNTTYYAIAYHIGNLSGNIFMNNIYGRLGWFRCHVFEHVWCTTTLFIKVDCLRLAAIYSASEW